MHPASRPTSTSTRPAASPLPRPQHQVNTQTKVLDSNHGRILCIADIRGHLSNLNDLARDANAKAIIHTGDFGFFESSSLERINDRTLRHLTMYSPLIPSAQRTHLLQPDNPPSVIRSTVNVSLLSEFPLLLSGQIKLEVPVFTVWGACEDVAVLEKFRSGIYSIDNLTVIDEATTRCLDVGGIKLRLLGLGGALVPHKMFDCGEGSATIAGGQGTMWTTALQIGELVDTAQRVFDQSETRLLITHASPGREGIMTQLALVLKADLTMSAGLHFRYATSYNEFSVQNDFKTFRGKLEAGKDAFDKVWDSVKAQVDKVIDDNQRVLLDKALNVVERIPPIQTAPGAPGAANSAGDEVAWKNCWNWNLCDAAYGSLILDIKEGRVSAELKSQGFNYAYRRSATVAPTPNSSTSALPVPTNANSTHPPTKPATPAPFADSASDIDKPIVATPPTQVSRSGTGPGTPKDRSSTPLINGASPSSASPNGDRFEREKAKKKEKKDRKDKEKDRTEKDTSAKEAPIVSDSPQAKSGAASGKATPAFAESLVGDSARDTDDLRSPATEASSGIRTPTSKKPRERNPWTIFMRMTIASVTDAEIRDFFGEAKDGITRITLPTSHPGRAKIAYVEFGDEEAMRAALEKHAEKLGDSIPDVKQAQDREARDGHRGRGRGRGGFAARGFAAAGLTRGGFHGNRGSPGTAEGSKGGDDS